GTANVDSKVAVRPADGSSSTVIFDSLPPGDLTAVATSYPQADGTGIAQAQASAPLKIAAGQNTPFTITMASTIDHLEVSPAGPTVILGQVLNPVVTARDSAGNAVLFQAS